MKYAFILNPAAGKGRDPSFFIDQIEQFCSERKLDHVLWQTERPGHGKILAEQALKNGFGCIVAIGGDGTINEIARVLLHTKVPLGIIPKGSGNGFAREFSIPLDIKEACQTLIDAKPLAIDVGKINEEYFFNMAGLGFDANVGYLYNQAQKGGRRGKLPYFTIGLKEYFSYAPQMITLSYDKTELRLAPLLVAIANCKQYGSGAMIAPKAIVNDGLLHLVIIRQAPWYQLLWRLPKVFNGTFDKAPFLQTILTKEVRITFNKEMPYHIDGEIRFGGTKLTAQIETKALVLNVPKSYQP